MAVGATMRRAGLACERGGSLGITIPRGVYEALAPLTCARCLGAIAVGDRFTRRKLFDGGPLPVCRACAPFAEPV
jgi:hypothetical protein